MSSQGAVSSADASIAGGRQAYARGRYKLALEHFTLTANKCLCNNGKEGRRTRCTCKDFARVARERGDIFREAMHTCSCGVSQKFNKCHDTTHIQALDFRIHVFFKLGRLDNAKRDAEWLLEIAPRALEGYLQLGKGYRLYKEPDVAHAIWSAGIDVASREGLGGTIKLKQLLEARAPLHKHHAKTDPLAKLPPEVVDRIFSEFSTRQIVRVLRVSKGWNRYLWSNNGLWKQLTFGKGKPSIGFLKRLAKHTRGEAESVFINGGVLSPSSVVRYNPTPSIGKWPLASMATQRVKHLTLIFSRSEDCPEMSRLNHAWNNLSTLHITNHDDGPSKETDSLSGGTVLSKINYLLHLNKDSLQQLSTFMHMSGMVQGAEHLPNFTRLRVLELVTDLRSIEATKIKALATLTPQLEQLSISSVTGTVHEPHRDWTLDKPLQPWEHLKAIRLICKDSGLVDGHFPEADLRSLVSYESYHNPSGSMKWAPANPLAEYCQRIQDTVQQDIDVHPPPFPTLKRYWDEGNVIAAGLRPCLEKSLASGSLSHLAFSFDDFNWQLPGNPDGFQQVENRLAEISWLYGQPSLKTLGLFNFEIVDGHAAAPTRRQKAQIDQLVKFVCSFQNLETFVAASAFSIAENICLLMEKIASAGRVKNFIIPFPAPTWMALQLPPLLAKYGAEVSFKPDERIPAFPLEL